MVGVLGWLLAVAGFGFALHFWRHRHHLHALLMEGARGFDELRVRYKGLETKLQSTEAELNTVRHREEAMQKSVSRASGDVAKISMDYDRKLKDLERRIRDTENQRDLMMFEVERHKQMVSELRKQETTLMQTQSDLRREVSSLKSQGREVHVDVLNKLRNQLADSQNRCNDLTRELRQTKSQATINPREYDTLKRKVGQYELLYTGMKGQREMFEERSKNWEFALHRLATWILTSSPLATPSDPVLNEGIGPIVGEALHRIGSEIEIPDGAYDEVMKDSENRDSSSAPNLAQ
jgi:chromosome segregation ATPase